MMDNEALIAAVQLSDRNESEQPDPLYIPKNETTGLTWRHFATLLKSLYAQPPDAVRVKYMDDEGDWIELGSDAELQEALKFTRSSGEILQLQVRRVVEKLIDLPDECADAVSFSTPSFEDSRSNSQIGEDIGPGVNVKNTNNQFTMYIPTTDPGGDVLPPLRYPHETEQQNRMPSAPLLPESAAIPACRMTPALPLIEATTPTETPSEPTAQASVPDVLVYPFQPTSPAPMSHGASSMFAQAAGLTSGEKIQFLKSMAKSHPPQQRQENVATQRVEPLCTDPKPHEQCLGKNSVPNQDPFDVVDGASGSLTSQSSVNSSDFQKVELLTPVPADLSQRGSPPSGQALQSTSVDLNANTTSPVISQAPGLPGFVQQRGTVSVDQSSASKAAVKKSLYSCTMVPKNKLLKKSENGAPVPMPRNLLMMEGAQSGANAVAIEMPSETDSYHSAAFNKDEEIAASGGTSSTSASEETGEVLAPGGSVAASVVREAKTSAQSGSCASAKGDGVTLKELAKGASVSKPAPTKKAKNLKTPNTVIKPEDLQDLKKIESFGVGAKPKDFERKCKKKTDAPLPKRKSMEKQDKKKGQEGQKKTLKDEESGELAVMAHGTPGQTAALQYVDFVKHMKKVKKDLHSSIVKDVTKQTDRLLRRSTSRSVSVETCDVVAPPGGVKDCVVHKGIRCDLCDLEIVGVRYKCGNCPDFDLCEKCEMSELVHDPTHVFLKLQIPARKAGCVDKERVPLLRENIYDAEKLWDERRKQKEEKKKVKDERRKEKEERKKEKKRKRSSSDTKEGDDDYVVEPDNTTFQTLADKFDEAEDKYEEKINKWSVVFPTPADTQHMFHISQDTLLTAREFEEAISQAFVSQTPPVFEVSSQQLQKKDCDELNPVVRERLDSDSSGSSIVRLSPPLPIIISDHPSKEDPSVVIVDASPAPQPITEEDGRAEKTESMQAQQVPISTHQMEQEDDDDDEDNEDDDDDARSFISGSSYEYFMSDDSEEFCVIAHPGRDELEEVQQEREEEEDVEAAPVVDTEETSCVVEAEKENSTGTVEGEDNDQQPLEASGRVLDTDENQNQEPSKESGICVTEKPTQLHWAQLVHNLTDKEKAFYEEILQKELEKEKSAKSEEGCLSGDMSEVVRQQRERERQTYETKKMQVAREEDYKDILEVKALQASIVNRQLEENVKVVVPASCDVPQAAVTESHKDSVQAQEEAHKLKEEPTVYSIPLTDRQMSEMRDRHVGEILELEGQKFAALDAGDQDAVERIERRLKDLDLIESYHNDFFDAMKKVEDTQSQQEVTSEHSQEEQKVSFSRQTSVASTSTQSVLSEMADATPAASLSNMKDADCQTVPEPVSPAGHLMQNVASSVSKAAFAASNAFSTAKDVFYSLQAKQNEKKTQVQPSSSAAKESSPAPLWVPKQSTWTPPKSEWKPQESSWKPPEINWIPPKSTWTPPSSDYQPPASSFKPPMSNWTPPPNVYHMSSEPEDHAVDPREFAEQSSVDTCSDSGPLTRGSEEETSVKRCTAPSLSSSPSMSLLSMPQTSPIASLNITDSALRREVQGMQRLIEMGFANREKNRQLLSKFDGDLERVVQSLLQEEGEDHWAFHRH